MKLKFLSTVAAVALLSTGAMAVSTITLTNNDGNVSQEPVTIASELLVSQTQQVDVNTTDSNRIQYKPAFAIGINTALTVTIQNGLADLKPNMTLNDANGVKYAGLSGATTVGTDGYSAIEFTVMKAIPAEQKLYFSEAEDSNNSLDIIANKDLPVGSKVTMQVTSTSGSSSIKTASEDILSVVKGFDQNITVGSKVIDVNEERKKFTTAGATTTATIATAVNAGADLSISLDSNDKYELIVQKSSCAGLKDEQASVDMSAAATTEVYSYADCKWTFSGNYGDSLGTDLITGSTLTVTTNTTDVIADGKWAVTLNTDLNDTVGTVANNLFLEETAINWTINGSQFIVPYLHTHESYGTFVVVTNASNKPATATMDVYADGGPNTGTAQTTLACENVTLASIPANSTATYYPDVLNTAIDSKCANFSTTNGRFMGKFTFVTPNNDIHAAAFQKDGTNGKRSIPVLTNDAHEWKN